jgi:hypothetical protein
LRFIFADEVVKTLAEKGFTEQAEYYAFAVEYASMNKGEVPLAKKAA